MRRAASMHALDVQLDLINYHKSEEGVRYMATFVADQADKGLFGGNAVRYTNAPDELQYDAPVGYKNKQQWGASTGIHLAAQISRTLSTAPTYYITSDMMDLCAHAAESIPETPFNRDDLPHPTGFVTFERSLKIRDRHDKQIAVNGMSWWVERASFYEGDPAESFAREALFIVLYSSKYDPADDITRDMKAEHPDVWESAPRYAMSHWVPIQFGEPWYATAAENYAGAEYLAFAKTFFLLVQQKVARVSYEHPDRATRRNLVRRHWPDFGDINVVALRKLQEIYDHDREEGDDDFSYSHRFLVTGHWRNQWYPSLRCHVPIWINEFVKGPEDKPLIIKDKVFVWRR